MKLTKSKLKNIIKEELNNLLKEDWARDLRKEPKEFFGTTMGPSRRPRKSHQPGLSIGVEHGRQDIEATLNNKIVFTFYRVVQAGGVGLPGRLGDLPLIEVTYISTRPPGYNPALGGSGAALGGARHVAKPKEFEGTSRTHLVHAAAKQALEWYFKLNKKFPIKELTVEARDRSAGTAEYRPAKTFAVAGGYPDFAKALKAVIRDLKTLMIEGQA
jgi:hypothetical protein